MGEVASIMKYKVVLHIIIVVTAHSSLLSDPIITLFIRPYPHISKNETQQVSSRNTLQGLIQPCIGAGIFATYAGFLNVSDCNGQLQFPRKQEHPSVHLLVTDTITPLMINGMTVDHWELNSTASANFYILEFNQDSDTHLYYWNARHAPLPENGIIPLDTIIIFAQPHDIYLPIGITLADNTPNFVLPPLYIKKEIDITTLDLYVLNVKHFFGALHFLFKQQDYGYSSLLIP